MKGNSEQHLVRTSTIYLGDVSRRHGVSMNAARSDVRLLVEKGVLEIEGRDGHRVMYRRKLESA